MGKVTFINAIVSGKVGGSVYARNKGGYYVRQWTKPTDPASTAQLQSRGSFGAASALWHGLTDVKKAQWNGYAISNFTAKHTVPGVLYSGNQAFISLRNTAQTGTRLKRTTVFTAPAVTPTFTGFIPSTVAPATNFSSAILDSASLPLNQLFNSCTLTSLGVFTAVMGFDRITPVGSPVWRDPIGQIRSGLVFYASNPLSQQQQFVNNPEFQIVGLMAPPTVATGWTATPTFSISMSAADLPYTQRKIWYSVGDIVQVTAYAIGEGGQLARIGSVMATIT
jgi:hypothetical protein